MVHVWSINSGERFQGHHGPLVKNCSRNFDLSINMALVNEDFLYYIDMKKFLKKSSSLKPLVRF